MADFVITPFPQGSNQKGVTDLTPEEWRQRIQQTKQEVLRDLFEPMAAVGQPPPNTPLGNVGPGIVFSVRSAFSLAKKIFLDASTAGGPGDELAPGERPNGQIPTAEQLAAAAKKLTEPHVLPMWAADP